MKMLRLLAIPMCASAVLLAGVDLNGQTGPIREGVRRTGEAVTEGGRAVVRGSREAVGRAGQATRRAVDATADAARAPVDRLNRSELNADARANAGVNADQQQWGTDTQYRNDPNMQGQYQSGYRGVDQQGYAADQQFQSGPPLQQGQVNYDNRVYRLRYDRYGREFICVGGRPVYFDNQQSGGPQPREAYKLSDEQMHSQGMRGQQQYQQRSLQSDAYNQQRGYGQPPAPPAPPMGSDFNNAAPSNARTSADTEISAGQQTEFDESADIDANVESSTGQGASNLEDSAASSDLDGSTELESSATDTDASTDVDIESDAQDADQNSDADDQPSDQSSGDNEGSST